MQEIILKQDVLKEDYQKPFKKLTFFVCLNPVLYNGQHCQKQKRGLKLVTSHSSGYETCSKKFLY